MNIDKLMKIWYKVLDCIAILFIVQIFTLFMKLVGVRISWGTVFVPSIIYVVLCAVFGIVLMLFTKDKTNKGDE